MTRLTAIRFEPWAKAGMGCLAAVVALNLAATAIRAGFVAAAGPYAATTGFEEFCLYNIWKAAHGFPVYEWPHREHYLLSFYNAGFYHGYALWTKAWRADGAELVAGARWLSAVFGLFGMLVQVHLLRRMVPDASRLAVGAAWGLAFLTWFGTSFTAWTPWSARPDIPAVALALAGFAAALHARDSGGRGGWWLSSLLFFAAWSFKQSVVWIFAGTVLYAGWIHAGWPMLARLVAPFGILAAITLIFGGEAYRYNLAEVPRIFAWLPGQSVKLLAQAVILNGFFFMLAAWAWRDLIRTGRSLLPPRSTTERVQVRWFAAGWVSLPPLILGAAQLALRGSAINNVLEGFVLVALLGSAAWLRLCQQPRRGMLIIGTIALVAMIPLPLAQLVAAAQGVSYTTVGGMSIGNLTKGNALQLAQRRRFAEWIDTLPKPLWTRDAMLQMPWFATEHRYPAFVLNHQFETDAAAKGVLEGAGFAEWIRRRHFASLLLHADDPLARIAREAGYAERPIPRGFDPLASEFGLDGPPPALFVRREEVGR